MAESLNRRLRQTLIRGAGLLLPGAANALAARVIVASGFEAVYITGAGIANTALGVPDLGLVTLSELVEHVMAIREAVEVPLIVDGDTGFGNALNLRRTVRLLERAGAKAIQKRLPGPHIANIVFGGKTPGLPRAQLAELGFAGIIYANAALQAAVAGMGRVLRHLAATGSLAGVEDGLASFAERQSLVDYDGFIALDRRYAESGDGEK